MKKIIASLFLLMLSWTAQAESVRTPGVWGFAVGSTQGTYFRAILEQANLDQKKYQFVFEHRPGAGGSIATRSTLDYKGPIILAHSAAFYVRPYLYPGANYRFDQFKPILVMGSAPAALTTRGKTLDQLLKQPRIILGTAGAGSGSHLMAEVFKSYIRGPEVTMVHFKDTNEAYLNVMGGHVDANFEFLGDAIARATPEIAFAGMTGTVSANNIPLLRDQGMPDMAQVNNIFAIYVPANMNVETYTELRSILLKAEQSHKVQELYAKDFTYKDSKHLQTKFLQSWHQDNITRFKRLTTGIQVQ